MPTTKKRTKTVATVEAVKAAAGKTWFEVSDEDTHIELSSRDNGDVGNECPGKRDIEEGKRLFKLVRKKFRQVKWKLTFEIVDEWVSVNLRKEPYTKEELAAQAQKPMIADLTQRIKSAVEALNAERGVAGCRPPFNGNVYDGHDSFRPYIKVNFGRRLLYLDRTDAGFVFAEKEPAEELLNTLVAQFPELTWRRSEREPSPRLTYNYAAPNNVIEYAGTVEFEAIIRRIR